MINPKDTVLFQGDSITDGARSRENTPEQDHFPLGMGYANIVAARLLSERPKDELKILNRGISGNRIVDLDARIRCDIINLKPNVLSILIGVNDTWHEFGSQNGVSVEKYERVYRSLLTEVREACPNVRFVLCEPFVLPCGVVTDEWVPDVAKRGAIARKLAAEFDAPFVAFQEMFNEALKEAPAEYWAPDGVHPSVASNHRMAELWWKTVIG